MNSNQLPSELPEDMSTELAPEFDYGKLNTEVRMVVQECASEIKNLMRHTTQDLIEIGQRLIDVKAQLIHGNFRKWLKAEFDWSIKTANRFMQVAEKFKCVTLTHLDITASALYLLASPSTCDEARTEALKRASQGDTITYTKAKVIISKYKKIAKLKAEEFVSFDTHIETVEYNLTKSTEKEANDTSSNPGVLVDLNGKEVETEMRFPSTKYTAYSPKNEAVMEKTLLFEVGHHLCITDLKQQSNKWIGKVAEVKEATTTDIEVVIRILLP